MIVTIVTFNLPQPTTLAEITKTFQGTAPKYQGIAGLLRKNYVLSEDGKRAVGVGNGKEQRDAAQRQEVSAVHGISRHGDDETRWTRRRFRPRHPRPATRCSRA